MKKSLILILGLLIFILTFCSCGIKQNIVEQKQKSEFEKSFDYLSNDTDFLNILKRSFQDLTNCDKLNFSCSSYIMPITLNDFTIGMLNKTKLLNEIKGFDNLNQTEQIKVFVSLYQFSEYRSEQKNIRVNYTNCEILLTFSKKVNNKLPIKFTIIDKNVDPRINYKPTSGLYILVFNEENIIIDSEYLLVSN